MDALTHAVEAYSCLQKNPLSDAYAWAAIDLVRKHMIMAVNGRKKRRSKNGAGQRRPHGGMRLLELDGRAGPTRSATRWEASAALRTA